MAEKPPKKEAAEPPAGDKAAPKAKKGIAALLTKTPVMLGGVMIIEFVVLVAGFKIIAGGQPKTANGADLVQPGGGGEGDAKEGATKGEASTEDKNRMVEIELVEFKALNKLSGHSFLYDVSMYITVKPDSEKRVTDEIKDKDALIKDRVRTIIAEMDPEKLGGGAEPGLETLRRQVKFQLDEILGEGLVEEVLVPRCIPFRTDY
jgi:flagellar basal body-associated protein FliL